MSSVTQNTPILTTEQHDALAEVCQQSLDLFARNNTRTDVDNVSATFKRAGYRIRFEAGEVPCLTVWRPDSLTAVLGYCLGRLSFGSDGEILRSPDHVQRLTYCIRGAARNIMSEVDL